MASLSSILGTNFTIQGAQGVAGSNGSTGAQGVAGSNGVQGTTGTQGISGTLSIVQNSQNSSYTLQSSDNGKHISITSGNITVPESTFSVGDVVTVFNNSSSSIAIQQGTNVTLRLAATSSTGNRSLSLYGICTILCVASNVFVISGAGIS